MAAIESMTAAINRASTYPHSDAEGALPYEPHDELNPRSRKEAWDARVIDFRQILSNINAKLGSYDQFNAERDAVFCVEKNGEPQGILCMDNSDPPDLSDVATMPGTSGNGRLLMESAVRQSFAWHKGGELETIPMGRAARLAFEAMGFVGSGIMTLDPNPETNRFWVRAPSGLKLRSST